ncbi:hypothetical protein FNF31_06096 [Cafeteria roenbergensis]|uniref:Activator of basal transcription 1 n=1 Tax=Cafeteria roenbergensis TaxID=33653 RepID=A0A5A8CSV8_CAFRO|nr:hypothetical protein FNF31_06096 [Cafeteria roenbergensis]
MDDTEAAAAVPAAAAASALPFAGSEESKRGVVYIARVPPFMKPAKVRHLLEAVGPTDRIYLVPEDDEKRRRRVKAGGNKKYLKHFGWHHLQEKLQYEQKLRAARLRAGLAAARRDNEAYLKRAEAAERIAGVERRKRKRASAEDAGTKGGAAAAAVEVVN